MREWILLPFILSYLGRNTRDESLSRVWETSESNHLYMFISRIDIKSFQIDATLIPGNKTEWSDFLAKTRTSITSKEGGGQEELVCCFFD